MNGINPIPILCSKMSYFVLLKNFIRKITECFFFAENKIVQKMRVYTFRQYSIIVNKIPSYLI